VDRILICKLCKFGKYICYNSRDIEIFPRGVLFLARPVHVLRLGFQARRSYASSSALCSSAIRGRLGRATYIYTAHGSSRRPCQQRSRCITGTEPRRCGCLETQSSSGTAATNSPSYVSRRMTPQLSRTRGPVSNLGFSFSLVDEIFGNLVVDLVTF